ncbi:MAG TPA: DNA topoisomerase IV subunit A [Burkholderiaceae bacterium]|nr:DNA topoisomerase IV subunit A [Burkholderiaceae bacterium]
MKDQPSLFDSEPPESLALAEFAQRAYLDYAVSVVKGRALPDVADGQKPVQRRILFAMERMGLAAGSRHVKSARVVGDVIGRFHPHGDQAAYDALVRMAQDFTLRYPLVDGQGNFGSRDGDGAAAYRYTEARLTPIARLLLDELDEGTVEFAPNFDGSAVEPKLMPARLPFVLLNGASGIAVGMATEVPSHNLREVVAALHVLMKAPDATLQDVMETLPGPDFAGGGQIISPPEDIREIYATGRGSLKVRARFRFEDLARGQWQLVVDELPPGASLRRVQEEIAELTNPTVKAGKKSLTAEQQQLRQVVLAVLDRMRDESSKDAAVRLVFEPRTAKVDRQEFVNTLLAHTSLETSVPVNLVMIGRDGRPRCKPLLEILREWIGFRVETVRLRSRHRLERIQDRIHILEGREIVLLHIDKVIRIIRQSDEPKPELIKAFRLSDRQAEDILEIRLRQLARLEAIRITQELEEKRRDEASLQKLLASEALLKRQVEREFDEDAKKYGDDRRTLIETAARATVETRVLDEPVTVIVSEKGFARARNGHGHDPSLFTFKAGDALYGAWPCRTVDVLVAVGSNGRVYSIPVAQLPSARGDGAPVTSMIELESGTQLVAYVAGDTSQPLLLATTAGHGFACVLGDLVSRQKGGKQFVTLDEGARPLRPERVDAARDDRIACLSEKGRLLVFAASEIKAQGAGGRGVAFMGLDDGEKLLGAVPCGDAGVVVSGTAQRTGKPTDLVIAGGALAAHAGHRARKGTLLASRLKPTGIAKVTPPAPGAEPDRSA